jgi:hypothetical protein
MPDTQLTETSVVARATLAALTEAIALWLKANEEKPLMILAHTVFNTPELNNVPALVRTQMFSNAIKLYMDQP